MGRRGLGCGWWLRRGQIAASDPGDPTHLWRLLVGFQDKVEVREHGRVGVAAGGVPASMALKNGLS